MTTEANTPKATKEANGSMPIGRIVSVTGSQAVVMLDMETTVDTLCESILRPGCVATGFKI